MAVLVLGPCQAHPVRTGNHHLQLRQSSRWKWTGHNYARFCRQHLRHIGGRGKWLWARIQNRHPQYFQSPIRVLFSPGSRRWTRSDWQSRSGLCWNIYGTTQALVDDGTVFKLTTAGVETLLHSFNGNDGITPDSLTAAAHGDLYGTTDGGELITGYVIQAVRKRRFVEYALQFLRFVSLQGWKRP